MKAEHVGRTLAVLDKHATLARDERGVATTTIRQLMKKEVPDVDGILLDYICAFGAHGRVVLERYVGTLSDADKRIVEQNRSMPVVI